MEIIFMRHARPQHYELLHDANSDPDIEQIEDTILEKTKKELDSETIEIVYSSPLKRSKQTTSELFSKSKMVIIDQLTEMHLGTLSNTKLNLLTYFKIFYFYISNSKRFQAESHEDFKNRCFDAYKQVLFSASNSGAKRIAIVSHNGVMLAILKTILKEKPFYFLKFPYLGTYTMKIEEPIDQYLDKLQLKFS